jgi:hypothetical protein
MTKAATCARATGRDIETGLGKVGDLLAPLGPMGEKLAGVFNAIGSATKGAFSEISKSGVVIGGLAGLALGVTAVGGGLFALAQKAAEYGSKIYEAKEKTGIAAGQLSGIMALTKEVGGNFDSLTNSLARAGANLSGISEHGAKAAGSTTFLARAAKEAGDSGLKPMGDRIQSVLAQVFKWNNEGDRNKALSELLGKGWMENVSTLKLLAEQGYAPAIAAAQRLGIYFDDVSARQAKEFRVALADLEGQASGLGLKIGSELIPKLLSLSAMLVGAGVQAHVAGELLASVGLILVGKIGDGLKEGKQGFKDLSNVMGDLTQAQTDFLARVQALTSGQEAQGKESDKVRGAHKAHGDALASLILREQEELEVAHAGTNESKKLSAEYAHTCAEIEKLVKAGGSYVEGLRAQALALEVYKAKLMEVKAVIPKLGEMPWDRLRAQQLAQEDEAVNVFKPPRLEMPKTPAGEFAAPTTPIDSLLFPSTVMNKTLAQLAQLPRGMDDTRAAEKALEAETQLSSGAFSKLAAVFPGLTEGEVAATAAGRKLIEQLTKMDKVGSFGDQFRELIDQLELAGDNLGGNLLKTVGASIDGIEGKLAEMAVKGKANFKELYQSMEMSLVKSGLQKGVSVLLSGARGLGGVKRDGSSASSALFVTLASAEGKILGALGKGTPQPSAASPLKALGGLGSNPNDASGNAGPASALGSLASGFSSVFGQFEKTLGVLGKGIGSIFSMFGGFLASGGDVTPGKAYVVGEKHPEWFLPRQKGTVVPTLSSQQLRPMVYSPVWNISTPDVDSFKRAQGQLIADGYRSAAMAHARNS